ncbi:MAG: hypothetical protein WAM11_04600 [Cyanobium sp.]
MIMLSTTNKVRTTKLAKALLTAGLLGGVACSILSAGLASARTYINWDHVFNPYNPEVPFSHQEGDKLFTNFKTNITNQKKGFISFDTTPEDPAVPGDSDIYDVLAYFDFTVPLAKDDYYSYDVAITDPGKYFKTVSFRYDGLDPDRVAEKVISYGAGLSETLQNNEAFAFAGQYTTLSVVDKVTGTGKFVSMTNDYTQEAPGPLPLFGAGAAFGFSRRIRSRIKKAHLA